ncbi:hypothetical protein LOC51_16155 [Rubrivivax sp. JA1024]|nr:hypothetical protein [Rubrivivax sp. JA1024]
MRRAVLLLLAGPAAVAIYNLDAIVGQIKFNDLCKREGGPRFLAQVEMDQGWTVEANSRYSYQSPFHFGHVAFVRYKDKTGAERDVTLAPQEPGKRPEFTFSVVDASRTVRYRYSYHLETFPDDDRFSKATKRVTDLRTGQVVASYTSFMFSWTKPERVLLAAPTGQGCWDKQSDIDSFNQNLYRTASKK